MDYELDADQQAIVDAVESLLALKRAPRLRPLPHARAAAHPDREMRGVWPEGHPFFDIFSQWPRWVNS